MKTPKTLYILIAVFCVFAIIAGIYAQFIEGKSTNTNKIGDTTVVKDRETIKEEFYNLFTDTLNLTFYYFILVNVMLHTRLLFSFIFISVHLKYITLKISFCCSSEYIDSPE